GLRRTVVRDECETARRDRGIEFVVLSAAKDLFHRRHHCKQVLHCVQKDKSPMTIASAALLLFLILDPLGNIPVFLSLLKELPAERQRRVLVRELLIALGVLMLFLWGGQYALELMHLRQESVSIAGGIVLFLIGLRMIFPPPEGIMGEVPGGEPFIVPIAIPMIAGPSG